MMILLIEGTRWWSDKWWSNKMDLLGNRRQIIISLSHLPFRGWMTRDTVEVTSGSPIHCLQMQVPHAGWESDITLPFSLLLVYLYSVCALELLVSAPIYPLCTPYGEHLQQHDGHFPRWFTSTTPAWALIRRLLIPDWIEKTLHAHD